MWVPVVINDCNYLLKCKQDSQISVFITNFKEIWVEQLSHEEIANRFQELNPLFDSTHLEEEELVQYIISTIKNISADASITLEGTDPITIDLKCKLLESFVKFKFNMQKGNDVMYFNEFSLPLMQSVQYLEMRQKKLFEVLEKKDKEIQEHVLENGEIKTLITKKFDRDEVLDAVPQELLVNVFGKSKQFLDTFSQNYLVIKFSSNVKKEGEPQRKKVKNSIM